MEAVLSALGVSERQRIEEVAERIVLLSDGAGQDVIDGFKDDIFDDAAREAFAAIPNQYQRALWLHINAPALFEEALNARQADVFRQSASCYSGFMAPANLAVLDDAAAKTAFHQTVAQQLGCSDDAVAIQIFKRLRPDTQTGEDVDLYQISIHHNRPPEIIDCVQASELVPQEVIRAVSSHITYEPANGHLEVLSKDTMAAKRWRASWRTPCCNRPSPARRSRSSNTTTRAWRRRETSTCPASRWHRQGRRARLLRCNNGRSLLVKIWTKDVDDIYAAARSLIGPAFDFRDHHLNYAKLSIKLKKVGKDRARTITVILRDDNKCNIKTKREKDRALCDRLLAKWHLVKEIGHVVEAPADAVAA
jgi:hypothetical protein